MDFKVESIAKPRSVDLSEKLCNHFNREGHNKESCYQLIGFLDWLDEKKRGGKGLGRKAEGPTAVVDEQAKALARKRML